MYVLMRPTLFPLLFRQENVKLLRYLGGTKTLEFNKVTHTRYITSDQCSQDNIPDLINLYSKSEALGPARHNGFAFEVVRFFKSMVSDHNESSPPNEYISGLVLSSCVNVGHLLLGRQCHGYLLKSGLMLNEYVKTALVRLYSMLSDVVEAMEVLICNPKLDTRSYNQILTGLVEKGYLNEALVILKRMLAEDMLWNEASYVCIFGLCGRLNDLKLGRQGHNKLLKSGVEFDESVCSAMIDMYGKCKEISSAIKVFDGFEHPNVVIWTTMLAAYSDNGSLEDSFGLFDEMLYKDVVPNESTISILLNVSAELFSMRCGNSLHALALKTGFKGHKKIEDAFIDMYARVGDIKSAEKFFFGSTYRDIVTWNMMICGYSLHGFGNESLDLFQEMLKLGENPNDETFVGVLNACGHLGLVEEGFYYLYELMKQKGVNPSLKHYMCIINMLIKARQLNEALSFIISTPSKWDVFAWTTLLSGCRNQQNYTLGVKIAELIPDDVASKVIKWCGVTEIRELMEIRDIKKEHGHSWVEVGDITYVFPPMDKEHPHYIYYKDLMKLVHKTSILYFNKYRIDVGDGLTGDSDVILAEEIAEGFALFKSPLEAPICIIKASEKIDGRCHTLMNLLSQASCRPITVRDAHHFHHFQGGQCSCADYW